MLPSDDGIRIPIEIVSNARKAANEISQLSEALASLHNMVTEAVEDFSLAEGEIDDVARVSKRTSEVVEEMGRRIREYSKAANVPITAFSSTLAGMNATDKAYVSLIKSATQYALALEKISRKSIERAAFNTGKELDDANKLLALEDKRLATAAERAAIEKSKADQKIAEIEVDRAGEEFAKRKAAEEAKAVLTQEKKLGLENAETQAFKNQLVELQKLAALDASRLQQDLRRSSEFASPVDSEQAALATRKLAEAEKALALANSGLMDTTVPLTENQKKWVQGLKDTVRQLDDAERQTKKTHKGLLSFSNFLRTAFGTLTAIAIFTVLQAIQQFFSGTLKAASDFRAEMAELNLAEAILSKKGMGITRQEFDKFIKDIEARYQYLSKLDATKIVADTAGAVQEFDVSKKQLEELANAIAFIQLKNKLLGREEADAAHIINAAMDARSNFFNGMGINITEALIKEKAYAMGLVKTGEEIDKATRFQAVLALLTEQTASKQEELNRQLSDSPLGRQLELQKEMEDTQLRIGQSLITVRDRLIEFFAAYDEEIAEALVSFFDNASTGAIKLIGDVQALIDNLGTLNDALTVITSTEETGGGFVGWLAKVGKGIQSLFIFPILAAIALVQGLVAAVVAPVAGVMTFLVEIASGVPLQQAYYDGGKAVGEAWALGFSNAISTIGSSGLFKNFPTNVREESFRSEKELKDTLTSEKEPQASLAQDQEDLQKALEKMNDEILEAQLKLAQDMEDAQIDLGRKLVDITTEYARKRADAEREYSNRVADINASYRDRLADIEASQQEANQKARNDELEREAKFQEQMRQLKEQFLMDLEDALHARDARQVLRLIKQYNLEKSQAEREHALEQENAQREQEERNARFARERADAERERKAKLAEAQRDYQDKLAKLAADEAAERAAAELAYQRKMEDLQREMQNRLEIVAANLIAEFNLTKEGLDAILALYQKYYSEISGIYAAMNAMLAGQQNLLSGSNKSGGNILSNKSGKGGSSVRNGFAEGGSMVANRPTTVTFGEAGLEFATFTPIGRDGRDVNKLFTSLSGGGGVPDVAGQVGIDISLSAGLEARITQNTLDEAGRVVTRILGSKTR